MSAAAGASATPLIDVSLTTGAIVSASLPRMDELPIVHSPLGHQRSVLGVFTFDKRDIRPLSIFFEVFYNGDSVCLPCVFSLILIGLPTQS